MIFAAMLAVERYGRRSDAFDAIIGATHDHFWDPYNGAYLDFAQAFRSRTTSIMPLDRFPELNCRQPSTSTRAGRSPCQ